MRILITYGTVAGSTRGVAERIAAAVAAAGHDVICRAVGDAPRAENFDAVVVGSAVHGQAWLPEVTNWLRGERDVLGGKPVWAFSVGMPAAVGRAFRRFALLEEPKLAQAVRDVVVVRDHRLFSGVVTKETFGGASRLAFRLMGCHFGDFRDWAAIDEYAAGIARQLRVPASA